MKTKYDIFISYRREGGYDTAKHLNDLLVRDGYKVSFDIDTLRSGDFDTQLLERIDQCKDFILIVDQHAFDHTIDSNFNPKNDWLRCELAYALKKNKNIVPVFLSGVTGFPANLPNDIAEVTKKNGPEFNRFYFNDFYKILKKRFLHSSTISGVKKGALLFLFILFIMILVLSLYNTKKDPKDNDSIELVNDDQLHISESIFHVENDVENSISNDITSNSSNTIEQAKEQVLELFCGTFQYAETLSVIWNLDLDPLKKKVPLDMGLLTCNENEDIEYAMGWFGTYFKEPQYWEITSFNLGKDLNTALVEMILRYEDRWIEEDRSSILIMCKIKLELDEFNNVRMSFVSGNDIPWILPEDDWITFTRQ